MIYLLIEFLDELVFGISEAAWPFIRDELALNYIQIGLALSLPGLLGNLVEPFIGVLGDVWKRRVLILGGGFCFALALALTATAPNFAWLLFALILFNPSSGAFVSLSQASLMDSDPGRHDQNMARWTFAGSLGVVIGPLLLSGAAFVGFGWRGLFAALCALALLSLPFAARAIRPAPGDAEHPHLPNFALVWKGFREAFGMLKDRNVLRWLILLEFSDLMLDVFYGFLPLYFVDVAGLTPMQAALSVLVWTGVGLLGDFLLIPLLEKVDGLAYLRVSVLLELILFPAFLLVPWVWLKLILVGLMGFFNAGWYAILMGRLYSAMPGKSASVTAVGNVTGFFGKLLPFGIGLAANAFGLGAAMWVLLAGPVALWLGLASRDKK